MANATLEVKVGARNGNLVRPCQNNVEVSMRNGFYRREINFVGNVKITTTYKITVPRQIVLIAVLNVRV